MRLSQTIPGVSLGKQPRHDSQAIGTIGDNLALAFLLPNVSLRLRLDYGAGPDNGHVFVQSRKL